MSIEEKAMKDFCESEARQTKKISIEQVCRDILTKAESEGIITFNKNAFYRTNSIQELTSGDLVGVAEILRNFRK